MSAERITEPPSTDQLGDKGYFNFWENRQNLQLGTYFWPVERPRALIVLVHGHGVHTTFAYLKIPKVGEPNVYTDSFVEAFNKNGYSVCALDNQSCGRSEGFAGFRTYFRRFDDLVNDTIDFVKSVQKNGEFANLDVYLVGGSAGGCVAVHAAHKEPDLIKGVILLAPMLSLEKVSQKGANRVLKPLAALFSILLPTLCVAQTEKCEMFPDIQDHYDSDPACWHGATRVRVASEFLGATDWVVREMPNMKFPFLCIHSEQDTMCDLDGSKKLYDLAASEDKTLKLVQNMWHILVHEPGSEKIREMVLEWLDARAKAVTNGVKP